MQALAARGHAPLGLFVKERVGFGEQIARRFDPKAKFIEHRKCMVGAVGDEQDRLVEVCVEGGKDWQARGAVQAKRLRLCQIFQQGLILRKCADVGEEECG